MAGFNVQLASMLQPSFRIRLINATAAVKIRQSGRCKMAVDGIDSGTSARRSLGLASEHGDLPDMLEHPGVI